MCVKPLQRIKKLVATMRAKRKRIEKLLNPYPWGTNKHFAVYLIEVMLCIFIVAGVLALIVEKYAVRLPDCSAVCDACMDRRPGKN
jgi:hypothetical protein